MGEAPPRPAPRARQEAAVPVAWQQRRARGGASLVLSGGAGRVVLSRVARGRARVLAPAVRWAPGAGAPRGLAGCRRAGEEARTRVSPAGGPRRFYEHVLKRAPLAAGAPCGPAQLSGAV